MPRARKDDADPLLLTRQSLIARLSNWNDQLKWQEFFETYWRLIYEVASKAGLREDEAQEVVQETCISVARNIASYDAKLGKFKSWLMNTTRWKINDQFRKRRPDHDRRARAETSRTDTIDRLADSGKSMEETWEEEWQRNLLDAGIAQLKRKVDAKQFQIFDCVAIKGWSALETSKQLGVNIAQVYLVKHRLKSMLKKEIKSLEA
jgi:RNA polymerase sigma factor (sigma-70 family)